MRIGKHKPVIEVSYLSVLGPYLTPFLCLVQPATLQCTKPKTVLLIHWECFMWQTLQQCFVSLLTCIGPTHGFPHQISQHWVGDHSFARGLQNPSPGFMALPGWFSLLSDYWRGYLANNIPTGLCWRAGGLLDMFPVYIWGNSSVNI